jgi:hypothetical protein
MAGSIPGTKRCSSSPGLFDDGRSIEAHQGRINLLHVSTRPDDLDGADRFTPPQPDGHGQFRLRKVPARGHYLARDYFVACLKFDPGADGVAVARFPDQLEADPMMVEMLVVSQQQWRASDLGEDNVQVAVAVDVGKRCAAPDDWLEEIAAALVSGHRLEASGLVWPGVPEELSRLGVLLALLDLVDLLLEMAVGR